MAGRIRVGVHSQRRSGAVIRAVTACFDNDDAERTGKSNDLVVRVEHLDRSEQTRRSVRNGDLRFQQQHFTEVEVCYCGQDCIGAVLFQFETQSTLPISGAMPMQPRALSTAQISPSTEVP